MLHGNVMHGIAMLEQCCNYSKQCRNNVVTMLRKKSSLRIVSCNINLSDAARQPEVAFLQSWGVI